MEARNLITDEMARRELARLVARLEGTAAFPALLSNFLPVIGRELSLEEYSAKYLEPLADALTRERNRGLDHPEWV